MYKTKPAIVLSYDADKILIHGIEGEERRVRLKDLALLADGPIRVFPENKPSFEAAEALALLQEEHPEGLALISWREFTDLAWGDAQAEHIVAAWRALLGNPAVEILDEGIRIRSREEYEKLLEREKKRRRLPRANMHSSTHSVAPGKSTILRLSTKTLSFSLSSMNSQGAHAASVRKAPSPESLESNRRHRRSTRPFSQQDTGT